MFTCYADVLQLFKRFGIFIYTGDRQADLAMQISELKDLKDNGLILHEDYMQALLILRAELSKE